MGTGPIIRPVRESIGEKSESKVDSVEVLRAGRIVAAMAALIDTSDG
jgi:hypothetical protein